MSFDIKYDRDGSVIRNKETEAALEAAKQAALQEQLAPVQEPVQEVLEATEENLQQETQEVQEAAPEEPIKQKNKEENFRNLRLKTEQLERERDEALKFAQELLMKQTKQSPVAEPDSDDAISIKEDDLVEGKHLKKYEKQIKKLQSELHQYQQKSTETAVELKLKAQYPDFDKVVCDANIEALRSTYPELAQTINSSSSDLYVKAVTAYTLIKRLGLHTQDTFEQEKALVQKNAIKPKPATSISPKQSNSPLSNVGSFDGELTDQLKNQLWKEMEQMRKKY